MNFTSVKSATGEAHSKIILFGEHAVVYGKSAIAIPFPLKMKTKITQKEGEPWVTSLLYEGPLKDVPTEMQGICNCIGETFHILKKPLEGINFEFQSDIPMGRGLGSSAAAATSVVRAIYNYFETPLEKEVLYHLVGLSESYAHGKPSGIDMMAVTSDFPIEFRKEDGATEVCSKEEFIIVVADTGMIGGTREAVSRVRQKHESNGERINIVIDEINDLSMEAKKAILSGDSMKLGHLMNENHTRLIELGVSNDILDKLVTTAKHSGALGAKLTGGGMGGCMIALAGDLFQGEIIGQQLIHAGAKRVWYFSTKTQEIYKHI